MAGGGLEGLVGLRRQRRRPRGEQAHAGGGLAGQAGILEQPGVEGRHPHHGGAFGHFLEDHVRVELRQEAHAGAGHQDHVAGHEQPMGMEDRQGMDQSVVLVEAPGLDQRLGVGAKIAMAQHGALGAAGGAGGVEDRGQVIRPALEDVIDRRGRLGLLHQATVGGGAQGFDSGPTA